jgi:hypothetical protein
MDFLRLLPTPETIPAPPWLFELLGLVTFTLHILLVNIVLGGVLIMLFQRFFAKNDALETSFHGAAAMPIPSTFAIAINLGVAPLLFLQVIYGTFIYTSSVLMATYWILVIPFLIMAYYGAYINQMNYHKRAGLAKVSLLITGLILLYIAFIYVNNMTMMVQPQVWEAYFQNSKGTVLNWNDPTLIPRYLHFVIASVAVGGLFLSILWNRRKNRGVEGADAKIKSGLQIFAIATAVQIIIGFWFLIALPKDIMMQFMGGNMLYTIIMTLGIIVSIATLVFAFLGKLKLSIIHLVLTVVLMVIMRANLRTAYLSDFYSINDLEIVPQYGVMSLFLLIFVVGLGVVWYMLKISKNKTEGRA